MASPADFLSAWESGDTSRIVSEIQVFVRLQRALFSPLAYSVNPNKFAAASRPVSNYRKFESSHLWVFRGREKMQEDTERFLEGISEGRVGYLQAATGLGKSTKIVRDVAVKLRKKVLVISPEERLVSLTWHYMVGVEVQNSGDLKITRLNGSVRSSSMDGGLVYMTASTLLLSVLCDSNFLEDNEVGLIYVDEAHFKSAEYEVLRCLSMLKFFGRLTVAFSTATPPNAISQEAYRDVQPQIVSFPFVDVLGPVGQVDSALPYHFAALSGAVLVFAADENHAKGLHDYYVSNDVDSMLLTSTSRSADWLRLIQKFLGASSVTKVVVTTFVLETGYTLRFDSVIDFSYRPVILWDSVKSVFLMRIRPISVALQNQRAGRAGRMGDKCVVYRMEVQRMEYKMQESTLVSDIQWYCWLQLFSIRSMNVVFNRAAEQVGALSLQKLRMILSSSMHPVLLLRYLDETGFVYSPFVEGLRAFFPKGFVFGKTVDRSYDECCKDFFRYRIPKGESEARIPMNSENFFLPDMLFVDHMAKASEGTPDDLVSYAGDAVLGSGDLEPKQKKPIDVKMLWETLPVVEEEPEIIVTNSNSKAVIPADKGIHRTEAQASLEGYPSLNDRVRLDMISAVKEFTEQSPVFPEVEVNWRNYDDLRYSKVMNSPPERLLLPRRGSTTVAAKCGKDVVPFEEVIDLAGEQARRRRSARLTADMDKNRTVVRGGPSRAVEVVPEVESATESVYPTVRYATEYTPSVRNVADTGRFHSDYELPPVRPRPELPRMVQPPREVYFSEIAFVVNPEAYPETMLFPYGKFRVNREKYIRPQDGHIDVVADLVGGILRVSDMSSSDRQSGFLALLKVWNANVTDDLQYDGKMQHVRNVSESGSSRNYAGKVKREKKVYRGKRFTTDELVRVFSAFSLYGLLVCVPYQQVPEGVQGHVAKISLAFAKSNWRMRQLMSSRDLGVRFDEVSLRKTVQTIGASDFIDAHGEFMSGFAWEYVWTTVYPKVYTLSALGFALGGALSFRGKDWSLGHIFGMKLVGSDLLCLGNSKIEPDFETKKASIKVGDYCFILVANPTLNVGVELTCGGRTIRIAGPLEVSGMVEGGFLSCKGVSTAGLSGSTVVSAVNGGVVGLLYGVNKLSNRVLVTLL